MLQFPSPRTEWQLDAVGILAVLGEQNIGLNSHMILSSKTCLLPRLLPAPQGLYADRPDRLPTEPVKLCGSFSGNIRDSLSYFGQLLHGTGQDLPDFSVRELTLTRKDKDGSIQLRTFAPLNVVAIVSCLGSIGLLVWAALLRDGTAVVGIILLSFTTSVLCACANWKLKLAKRHRKLGATTTPRGDVVLRSAKGCFTVVHCDEEIARMIYFGPEEVEYLLSNPTTSRVMSGIAGGLTLTVGIIMFSNMSWTMQVAHSTAYAILNAAYWACATLPARFSWDLSSVQAEWRMFDVEDANGKFVKRDFQIMPTFTRALYQAIVFSKTTGWVVPSSASPNTAAWSEWLRRVDEALVSGTDDFDPQQTLSDILHDHKSPV